MNEVASGVAGSPTALAIIPAGSGNGLARMLGIPTDPTKAIERFLHGSDRLIDAGEIDGRMFVNVAGVGFDAHVAARFASLGRARRGLLRYAAIVSHELWRYESRQYEVQLDPDDGAPSGPASRAFLLSFANGSQWGNGAVIAPGACLDDGLLEAVQVEATSALAVARAVPHLFRGTIATVAGVTIRRIRAAIVKASFPLVYHADGESYLGGSEILVRVRDKALRLRA